MKQLNRIKVVLVRWCTNTSQPDLETLFRIADVLNVDVRELIHVEKRANPDNFQEYGNTK